MSPVEFFAANIKQAGEMLKMTLSDFTDAEMVARPCTGANHPAWQLGHLIASTTQIFSAAGAKMPELPSGFAERFGKETSKNDDHKAFGTRSDLLALFDKANAAVAEFAATRKPEDLNTPTPEFIRKLSPAIGNLLGLQPLHIAMHIGQMQAARRKLSKPVLF